MAFIKKTFLVLSIFLSGCSSTQLVSNWKNPEIVLFDAYKVLVVGMTDNEEVRTDFESKLQKVFESRNVEAVRSIDLFDVEFTATKQTEEELSAVEDQLLQRDFDAILFTKIVGSENVQTMRTTLNNTHKYLGTFKDDYLKHQGIYYEDDYYETFTVFHAETSLYCICVGKERQTIWNAGIDITDPKNFEKSVDDYIQLLEKSMEEQNLIFRKNELTNL